MITRLGKTFCVLFLLCAFISECSYAKEGDEQLKKLQKQVYEELLKDKSLEFANEGWQAIQDHLQELKSHESDMNVLEKKTEAMNFKKEDIYQVRKETKQMAVTILKFDDEGWLNCYVFYFYGDQLGKHHYAHTASSSTQANDIRVLRQAYSSALEDDGLLKDRDGDGWWDRLELEGQSSPEDKESLPRWGEKEK